MAAGLPYRLADPGEADAETDDPVVLVLDDEYVLHVDDQTEVVDHQFLHARRKGNGAVDVLVGMVQDLEESVRILPEEIVGVLRRAEMKFVALHKELAALFERGILFFGRVEPALRPVHFLFVAAGLDVLLIVRRVVLLLKCGRLVEAFDEEAFPLQI